MLVARPAFQTSKSEAVEDDSNQILQQSDEKE
jgi:hypothetical protein